MPRRTVGAIVSLVGVTFLVVVLGNGLFGASSAWEDLSDDVRPGYTDEAIAGLRADAQQLRALTNEFGNSVLPTLAQALGISEAELTTRFLGQFPATAQGVLTMPQIANALDDRAQLLEEQQANFRSADAIPTASRSSIAVPWFITITGILAIIAGLLMMQPGRAVPALLGVLGVIMLAVPLVTSLPQKAADADALNEAVVPIFSNVSIDATAGSITTLRAMAVELEQGLVPGLAQQLGITAEQAGQFVQTNFPAIAAALTETPQTLARLEAANELVAANTGEFAEVREVPNRMIAWTVVIGGIATILLASIALMTNEAAVARAENRRARRMQRAA
ncbi:MAG TPA: hypothetical protein VGB52_14345 [Actinomycetota bacterium]